VFLPDACVNISTGAARLEKTKRRRALSLSENANLFLRTRLCVSKHIGAIKISKSCVNKPITPPITASRADEICSAWIPSIFSDHPKQRD
jgi:hypothetical protein